VGRCGENRGSHQPFIGARARRRGVAGGSNGGVNGFNAIENGGGVKRGIRGGMMAGQVTAQAASKVREAVAARSSSTEPDVRDDRWGPPVIQARRGQRRRG
jgi:hypothetical protein